MTDAYDLLAEARWEREGTRRATERYRQAAAVADPSTLPSGQKLLRDVVPALTAKIIELQRQGMEAVRSRTVAKWAAPIQLLPADTLAVITVIRSLRGGEDTSGQRAGIVTLAEDVAQAVADELEYRRWVEAQVAAKKAAKEAQ